MAKKGIDCKLYRNSATYGTPTWVEVDIIKDFSQSVAWDKAEGITRGNRIKRSAKTMLGLSWSGSFEKDGSANSDFLVEALLDDLVYDFLVLDGPISTNGVRGYRCDCQVFSGTENQGTDTILYPEIEIMPTFSDNVPQSVKIVTGSPVYTDVPTPPD